LVLTHIIVVNFTINFCAKVSGAAQTLGKLSANSGGKKCFIVRRVSLIKFGVERLFRLFGLLNFQIDYFF